MANLETLELKISSNAQEATKGLNKLISSLTNLDKRLTSPLNKLKEMSNALAKIARFKGIDFGKIAAGNSAQKIKDVEKTTKAIKEQAEAVKDYSNFKVPAIPVTKTKEQWDAEFKANIENDRAKREATRIARESAQAALKQQREAEAKAAREAEDARAQTALGMINNSTQYDLMQQKIQGMVASFVEESRAGKLSAQQMAERAMQIKRATAELDKMKEKMNQVANESTKTGSTLNGLKNLFKGLTSGITNFLSRIKRIAVTMAIRKAIRGLISAMKEGVTNVYQWSKQMSGPFAQSMDEAKGKIQTLKNSLGAMLMPVVQALLPLFHSVTNAIIDAANWLNQFISLLTGKTSWVKATEQAGEYEQAAQGAAKANRDVLASWDELEVLQKDNGGGGSSAANQQNYENMFQEMNLFDEKVRSLVTWLQDNLNSLIGIAAAIGTAFLAWNVSTAFSGIIGTIAGWIATGAVIALTAQVSWLLTNEYLETGDAGWLIADALTTAVGATAAWAIASKLIGGQAGAYAFAITLTFSAVAGIVANLQNTDVGVFSKESIVSTIENALKVGVAGTTLLKVGGQSMLCAATGGAGAALATFGVAIGLKGALDENIDLFSMDHVINLITSAGATTLGIALVSGSWWLGGAAAIITVGAFIGIKVATDRQKMRWGDWEADEKEIQAFVNGRIFKPTAKVEIEEFETISIEKENLEQSIRDSITTANVNLNLLQLGVDVPNTSKKIIDAIQGDANGNGGLIAQVKELCNFNIDEAVWTFSNIAIVNADGQPFSSSTLLQTVKGWQDVSQAVENDGKKLIEYLQKGALGQLEEGDQEIINALMARVTNWANIVTTSQEMAGIQTTFETNMISAMSQNSFENMTKAWQEANEAHKESAAKAINGMITGWFTLANYYESIGDSERAEVFRNLARNAIDGIDTSVRIETRSRMGEGREEVIEFFESRFKNIEINNEEIAQTFIDSTHGVYDSIGERFKEIMNQTLLNSGNDITPVEIQAMNIAGIYGWDMLSDNVKRNIREAINLQPEDIESVLVKTDINAIELIDVVNWENFKGEQRGEMIQAFISAYGSDEAIAAIKARLPGINAGDLFKIVDWESFDNDQKIKFMMSISTVYESEDVLAVARGAGIDVGEIIVNGMESVDPKVANMAKEWSEMIGEQDYVAVVTFEANKEGVDQITSIAEELANTVTTVHIEPQINIDSANGSAKLLEAFGDIALTITPIVDTDSIDDVLDEYIKSSERDKAFSIDMQAHLGFEPEADPESLKLQAEATGINMKATAEWKKSGNQNSAQVLASDLKNYTGAIQANASWKTSGKKKAPETLAEQLSDYSGTIKAAVGWAKTKSGKSYPKYMAGKLGDYTGTMKTNLEWKTKSGKTYPKYMAGKLGDYTGTMKSAIAWAKNKGGKTALQSMLSEISGSSATITADTDVNKTSLNNTVKTIEGMSATITVSAKLASDAASGLKKAIESGIGSINLKVKKEQTYGGGEKWVLQPYANGGLVNSGDIYVANENGKSELIGRFGNQAAVANQEQMVEAMARGVAYANSEQNSLLREQNGLLRAILRKEASIKLGASSSLGRTVRKSLDMYDAVTGG